MDMGGNSAIRIHQTSIRAFLKVDENFETSEQRKALGIISIHVGDLLIRGSDVLIYITMG